MKKVLLFICLFTLGGETYAQMNEFLNHQKYWNYRNRLKSLYVVIGKNDGNSIPLERRTSIDSDVMQSCANNYLSSSVAVWSDNGNMDLGNYIAILSTEAYLLTLKGNDPWPTYNELYYALYAVDRLDRRSTNYLTNPDPSNPIPQPDNPDGLLLRDDVPRTMVEDVWGNFDNSDKTIAKAYSDFKNPYETNDCSRKDYESKNIVSQDEIIGLLNGLQYVIRLLPNVSVQPRPIDDSHKLVDYARALAHRIMSYCESVHAYKVQCNYPLGYKLRQRNWKVVHPDAINQYGHQGDFIGTDLWWNAYGISKMGNYLTGNSYSTELYYSTQFSDIPSERLCIVFLTA